MENNGILEYLPYKVRKEIKEYNYISFESGYYYSKKIQNNFMFGRVIEHRWGRSNGPKHILIGSYSDEEIAKWIMSKKKVPEKNPRDLFGGAGRSCKAIYHKDGNIFRGSDKKVETGKGYTIWLVGGYINDSTPFWKLRIQKVTGECELIDFEEKPTEKHIEYYKVREEIL